MTNFSVPWIRSGPGNTPANGGCVMQVLSWIKDGSWIDDHSCVHPAIRNLAIRANDKSNDKDRQRLIDLIPRMINTATDDKIINVKLAIFSAEKVLHLYESKYPNDSRPRNAIEAAKNYVINPAHDAAYAADYAAYTAYTAANAAIYAAYTAYAAAYAANAAVNAAYAAIYAANAAVNAAYAADDAACNLIDFLDYYDTLCPRKIESNDPLVLNEIACMTGSTA